MSASGEAAAGDGGSRPGFTDLGARSWRDAFRRTLRDFRRSKLSDWAAALTYYGVLAIFPALLVVVSLLGLIGGSVTDSLLDNLEEVAPGPAQEILTNAITNLEGAGSSSGLALLIGLGGATWASSGYVRCFMSASNEIYEVEGRRITRALPVRIGLTMLLMVLAVVIVAAVTLSGDLARELGDLLGVGDSAMDMWEIAKWPALLLLVSFLLALLYWGAPNVRLPFRVVSPGGLLAVAAWLLGSAAFSLYVTSFGSYNKTYGALAGPIVFLLWLWISNMFILLGAALNAELERGRALAGGAIADADERFAELRDGEERRGSAE